MIKERHMKQGRRVDNGEICRGYLAKSSPDLNYADIIVIDGEWFANDFGMVMGHREKIDPASVEDVAVEPIEDSLTQSYQCPNCEAGITCENYCYNCGQRIGWK